MLRDYYTNVKLVRDAFVLKNFLRFLAAVQQPGRHPDYLRNASVLAFLEAGVPEVVAGAGVVGFGAGKGFV
jgi:hypothetical protein